MCCWLCLATYVCVQSTLASDTLSCRQLVQLVGDEKPVDQQLARELMSAASTTPQLKCVAAEAMALLLIRDNDYSAAWSQMNSESTAMASAPRSVQLECEKIKLWLLVEARSTNADAQLKRLVSMTIHADTDDSDRQDASYFLGKLLKLLDSCETTCGVKRETIDRAREILSKQSGNTAVTMYQTGWTETQRWDDELRSLWEKCRDQAAAQATSKDLHARFDEAEKSLGEAKASQKAESDLEDDTAASAIRSAASSKMFKPSCVAKLQ